jgi:DNA-binding winged helix-turn-helix (wHTH) protein
VRLIFGEWTLDGDRRLLLHGSDAVSLSPRAFELLKLLAEHHERAFSKAELHQHLWPNTFVSDGSLTILVNEIRQVLKDDAERPRFIRTVRRFGYGFCGVVTTSGAEAALPARLAWLIWGDRTMALVAGETILGRASDATIRFDVPGVSRRHARITVHGSDIRVEDLASQNGTYVRGEKISAPATLGDGDELRLGPLSILVRLVSDDSSTVPM